ncbi:MAG: SLC13 family permease [Chitinophagales bacterium]|nr:SLC13 family permease [Bacteroidota bacterium]MCB9044477.1 SLC13 family permease [Chitinophagales bacterium]
MLFGLDIAMIWVLAIVIIAIVLYVTEWISSDVTSSLILVLLIISGVLTPQEGFSGFNNVATVSVFSLLVLSLGLQSTGAVHQMGEFLEQFDIRSEAKLMIIILIIVGISSAFLNNTAIVAIFLPVVVRLSKIAGISSSRLLIPLSFTAIVGGTLSLIGTSTNVLVSSIYLEKYGEPFHIFEFSGIAAVLFAIFLLYMLTLGRWLLPKRTDSEKLTTDYDLSKFLVRITINENCEWLNKSLDNTDLYKRYHVDVLELMRVEGDKVWLPSDNVRIRVGDTLIIKTNAENIIKLRGTPGVQVYTGETLDDKELTSEETVIVEAIIGTNSFLLGKKMSDIDFKSLFNSIPLAIRHRNMEINSQELAKEVIQFGDTLLLESRRKSLEKFSNSPEFILLEKIKKDNFRRSKLFLSVVIVVSVIVIATMGILPLEVAGPFGCLLLILTNCISAKYIYRKMDWNVIFMLGGILPLGLAVEKTGLSKVFVDHYLSTLGHTEPYWLIGSLFVITTLLTNIMSNNATAILLAPIAISIANHLNLSPKPLLATVMFAASMSFLTPIGYQTNALVYGIGKYKFSDFFKIGFALSIFLGIVFTYIVVRIYF